MPRRAKKEKEEEQSDKEVVLYEVGYHVVPLVGEEALPAESAKIREAIEEAGGMVTSEHFPTLKPLAYEITRQISGKKQTFSQAYFGWSEFEVPSGDVVGIKEKLDANPNILRFILVKVEREQPMAMRTAPIVQTPAEPVSGTSVEDETKGAKDTASDVMSEEDLDKTIEELVID